MRGRLQATGRLPTISPPRPPAGPRGLPPAAQREQENPDHSPPPTQTSSILGSPPGLLPAPTSFSLPLSEHALRPVSGRAPRGAPPTSGCHSASDRDGVVSGLHQPTCVVQAPAGPGPLPIEAGSETAEEQGLVSDLSPPPQAQTSQNSQRPFGRPGTQARTLPVSLEPASSG